MRIHSHSNFSSLQVSLNETKPTPNSQSESLKPQTETNSLSKKESDQNKKPSLNERIDSQNKHSQNTLNEEDLKKVEELKLRDREVRTHESAHLAAAGQYATSGAKYQYQRGPDGKNYAVSGEVSIDTSKIPNNPEATIKKAQQIQAAARAPAEPSSQDRQVAAEASQMEVEARAELAEQRQLRLNESQEKNSSSESSDDKENKNNATKLYKEIDNTKAEDGSGNILNLIA